MWQSRRRNMDVHNDMKVTAAEMYKRRELEKVLGKNDEEVDDDYFAYLLRCFDDVVEEYENNIVKERENDTHSNRNDDIMMETENDDDHDPQYRIFLSCFKKQGNSYTLQVTGESGVEKFVEYEREEDAATNDKHETDYEYVLNNIEISSDLMIITFPEGYKVEYEKDITSHNNLNSSDDDSCVCISNPFEQKDAPFRCNVMSILKKPWDSAEYKKLKYELSIRKNKTGDRSLRGRSVTYIKNEVGDSYLDHHKDVAVLIKSVQHDRLKELKILRGFYYWLENLTEEGAFIPWKDPECLGVMVGY